MVKSNAIRIADVAKEEVSRHSIDHHIVEALIAIDRCDAAVVETPEIAAQYALIASAHVDIINLLRKVQKN